MSAYVMLALSFGTLSVGLLLAWTAAGFRRIQYAAAMTTGGSEPSEEPQEPSETAAPDGQDRETKTTVREIVAILGAYGEAADSDEEGIESREVEEAPIVRLATSVIQQAIKERASDIHVEPDQRQVRVRYRIDGVLHENMQMPKYIQMPLTARFKDMAGMDVTVRRAPQNGGIGIRYEGKDYNLRASSLPGRHGETIVLHFYDHSSVTRELRALGFHPETQAQLEELTQQASGIILMTGPANSGKTTTAYSLLHSLNGVERNLVTVEAEREYALNGITQVVVNAEAGRTFAAAMASLARQDADAVLIGELDRAETARLALEAARSRLILSTIRASDAVSALDCLFEMSIERSRIAGTLLGVLAQRIVRQICANCKEVYEVESVELRRFGYKVENPHEKVQIARGRGCEMCRQTGYRGRFGLFQLLTVNAEIAAMIRRNASPEQILEAARVYGMHELREDGLIKILEGFTTPQEVLRVLPLNREIR